LNLTFEVRDGILNHKKVAILLRWKEELFRWQTELHYINMISTMHFGPVFSRERIAGGMRACTLDILTGSASTPDSGCG
jgi:hypothetical protein